MQQRADARAEPRYAQVARDLRYAIARGGFADGAPLPTESALCATYGVSRFTVREALRRLQLDGLIRRRRGSGTVVDSSAPVLRQPLSDVGELLQYAAGSEFGFEIHGLVTLSAARAGALRLAAGSRWIHATGVRTIAAAATPIAATEVYIHLELEPLIPQLRAGHETLFAQLARHGGFRIARVEQDIEAIGAGAREAQLLGIARRSPCLRIRRTYTDERGRTAEVSSSVHPGDRFTYSMHIDN